MFFHDMRTFVKAKRPKKLYYKHTPCKDRTDFCVSLSSISLCM